MEKKGLEAAAEMGRITVEGKPLTRYLDEKRGEEAARVAAEIIEERSRGLARGVPARFVFGGKQGVETRARTWTPREIRRRKGIMAKPYGTVAENILWCVIEKGPLTAGEIGAELGKDTGNMTSILSRLHRGLPDLIQPDKSTRPWAWQVTKPISVEHAYKRFKAGTVVKPAKRRIVRRRKPEAATTPLERIKSLEKAAAPAVDVEGLVIRAVEKMGAGEQTIHVKVSHRIDVRFGILKEGGG